MPAAFATFAHFSSSSLMCAANSSGVLPTGSAPSVASLSSRSFDLSAFAASAWMRVMMSGGVPAGARKPYHCVAS
jgi:hypothetical protein